MKANENNVVVTYTLSHREFLKGLQLFLTQARSLFLITLKENVPLTLFAVTTILFRISSSLFTTVSLYTSLFMKPIMEKSIGSRSGDRGDLATFFLNPSRTTYEEHQLLNMRSVLLSPSISSSG